jgi:tRNA G46 methylase TrmB
MEKTDPDTRKAAEEKMQAEWKKWMNDHANIFADIGAGVGKTKVVTAQGISDSSSLEASLRSELVCAANHRTSRAQAVACPGWQGSLGYEHQSHCGWR